MMRNPGSLIRCAAALFVGATIPVIGADLLMVLQVIPPLDLLRFARP